MKVERKSNYELLRIISMLFIVLYHMIFHGQILTHCTNPNIALIFQVIEFIIIIHVNSYILVTGYFQSNKSFKQSKIWSIVNVTLFYLVVIIIICSSLGLIHLSKIEMLNTIFSEYWFIKVYLLLYILSPFLNKLIEVLSQKDFKKLLIVFFLVFSIIPYLTINRIFENDGYTICNFIFLYFIGAYLKKFKIIEEKFVNHPFKKKLQFLLVSLFVLFALSNFFFYKVSFSLSEIHPLINATFGFPVSMSIAYSNPFIIMQTIVFFLFFGTLNFHSKLINKLSRYTLEVYLIHDSGFIRPYLYKWLRIQRENITSYRFILYVFIVVLGVYIACSFMGMIRQALFRFIYNRKVAMSIRKKYYDKVEKVKIKFCLD